MSQLAELGAVVGPRTNLEDPADPGQQEQPGDRVGADDLRPRRGVTADGKDQAAGPASLTAAARLTGG
jgi:hypothetical protein